MKIKVHEKFDYLDKDDITKDDFKAYVEVQRGGRHNMLTDATGAMIDAGLDPQTYWSIIKNYSYLANKFKLGNR